MERPEITEPLETQQTTPEQLPEEPAAAEKAEGGAPAPGAEQPPEAPEPGNVESEPPAEPPPPEQLALQPETEQSEAEEARLRAVIEAIVYVAEEPASAAVIAGALGQPQEKVKQILAGLAAEYNDSAAHGILIREVAGGYQMTTKPEHHESIRAFVKRLKPPLKLSLPALETLAVIAYKQPVTAPEIQEIRGVHGVGVLKTLLERKLITTAGRKNVVGRPILYKTTKEFLVQFGLKDLNELPTLKEFEELRRLAFSDDAPAEASPQEAVASNAAEAPPQEAATPATADAGRDAEQAQQNAPEESAADVSGPPLADAPEEAPPEHDAATPAEPGPENSEN